MAARPRDCSLCCDRRPPRRDVRLQLLQSRPGQRAQCRRLWWRRIDGHRLLSNSGSPAFVSGEEPVRVVGSSGIEIPNFHTDRLSSAILDFPTGQCVFTCSTQLVPYQRVQISSEPRAAWKLEIPVQRSSRPFRAGSFVDNGRRRIGERHPDRGNIPEGAINTPSRAIRSRWPFLTAGKSQRRWKTRFGNMAGDRNLIPLRQRK